MNCIRALSLIFLIVVVGRLSAGEPAADFSIEASVAPGGVMPPATQGAVTITITNEGPDTGTAIFRMLRTDDGTGFNDYPPLEFQFPGGLTGPCQNAPQPPLPGESFLVWIVRDILAGESRTCTFAFLVADTEQISQIGRWRVETSSGPDDPNDANNVADVLLLFGEPPEPVSVPALSAWAAIVLVLMLGALALRSSARHWP